MQTRLSACYDRFAEQIIGILRENGFRAYYVGGCVRDALLGREPQDFDIATDALPQMCKGIFTGRGYPVIDTGLRHGTVTVAAGSAQYEVTTFRVDGDYKDHRHPDSVEFVRSLKSDLERRDFTINAMAYSQEDGLQDFFGGAADLKRRIIRCVGDPARRFTEDGLRILRALRFSAELHFGIEPETAKAAHACKSLLRKISVERISAELAKILLSDVPSAVLRGYVDVFSEFLPELLPAVGFQQNTPWHIYDVFEHTLRVVDNTPKDLVLRLAALFHDIGKPAVYTQDAAHVGHFRGHAKMSAAMAQEILTRLRFARNVTEDVCLLILHHDDRIPDANGAVRHLIARMKGPENALRAVRLEMADHSAQNLSMVEPRQKELAGIEQKIRQLTAPGANECFTVRDLKINGNDLIAAGIPQGRAVGEALDMVLKKVMQEELPNERETLLQYISRFI